MIKHKIKKTIILLSPVFSTFLISTSCTNKNIKTDDEKDALIKQAKNLAIQAEKIINEKFSDPKNAQTKENILYLIEKTNKFTTSSDVEEIKEVIKRLKNFIDNQNIGATPDPSKPKPKPGPAPNPNPNPNAHELKLGFWNVCNYGSKALYKTQAIASIIYKQQFDLIGLAEIDANKKTSNLDHIDEIIELLNKQEQTISSLNRWKYILSDKYLTANGYKEQADGYIGMLYKENIVEPIAFEDGKVGKFYDNSTYITPYGGGIKNYNRPPYGVKFKFKNNDFTYMIAHFDGPGANKNTNEDSYKNGNGSSEMNEAASLEKVFEWFDQNDGDNKDLIFAGDTNINEKNHKEAFKWVYNSNKKYINIFEPNEDNKTSLKRTIGEYANSYDKIIHSGDVKYKSPYIYKLYEFVKDNSFLYSKIDSLKAWKQYIETKYNKSYRTDAGYIYYGISDHCPIGYTLSFS